MSEPKKSSKADIAFTYLREKIRTREFEPGHRLVLSQLATELNMSVVPVREAVRRLEAGGLVDFETNVGARVSMFNREAYFETMETVAIVEAHATRLSTPHLSAGEIAAARAINDQMRALLDDFKPEQFTELNRRFHTTLFQRCPNSHLVEVVFQEWERLEHYRVSTFRHVPQRAKDSVAEHEQLLALIEANADPEYIEKMARRHRMTTADTYRHQLDTHKPSTPTGRVAGPTGT